MYKNRKDMRNITAILVALLLAASCSAAPSGGSAISVQPTNEPELKSKCAEAIAVALLNNPEPAILGEGARPEYGPWSAIFMTDAAYDRLLKWEVRLVGTNSQDPDGDFDGFSNAVEICLLDSDPTDTYDPALPLSTMKGESKCAEIIAASWARQRAKFEAEDLVGGLGSSLYSATDADFDGINRVDERRLGTNPNNLDTDGDGISDGEECIFFDSDPLDSASPGLSWTHRPFDPHNPPQYSLGALPEPDDWPPWPGHLSLSTTAPSCASVTIKWAPRTYPEVASFTLASKAPGAGWTNHSTHLPGARSFTIGGLVSGLHSFQVRTAYTDGNGTISNTVEVAVSDCPTPTTTPPPPTTTPPPPTTTPPPPTTTIRPLGSGIFLSSTAPSCTSVTIKWNPSTYLDLQSFTMASKAPGGGWTNHSTHLPGARSFTIGGLVSGIHSFQVLATYTNGITTISNLVEVAVSDCPPPGSEDD